MTPHDFIRKWRDVELKERTASQSHFNDLCALLGVLDPVSALSEAGACLEALPDGSILAGSPDDIVRGVQRYQELGANLVIFDFRMRFPDWLDQINLLATEVLPRVSEAQATV